MIEGNSFLKFVDVDFTVMAARAGGGKIKASARRALKRTDALYLFDGGTNDGARERFAAWCETSIDDSLIAPLPVYTRADLSRLIARLSEIHAASGAPL